MGRDDFVVNSQQDVPEVLNYLLDNFCGISVLSQDQIKVVIRNRITCTNCLQSDDREDIHMILKLNVAGNVNSAFNNYLNEEVLLNRECSVCLSKQNASLEKRVVVAGKYVIIHLKRYLLNDGGWVKDMSLVNYVSEQLSFSVDLDDDVQCRKSYHLVVSAILELWLQITTPLMSCTNRIVSGFCVMIRQCCQYNLSQPFSQY